MEIKAIYLEPDMISEDDLASALKSRLVDFTAWHGMEKPDITESHPAELREALL
jgi:hypothetical protein